MQLRGLGLVMGATLWLAVSCRSNDPGPAPRPATGADDYAVARTRFHTTLTKQAPSPQSYDPQKLPDSAREVTFDSGGLHLTAWVSAVASGAPPRPAVLFLHGGFAFDLEDWQMASPFATPASS